MRKCADWVQSYVQFTETSEAPEAFHAWCGLSAIAATLGRQVFLDRGYYILYPNLYIVLVAGSATSRKSTAISISVGLMRLALPDVQYISQRLTTEAFIHALSVYYKKHQESVGYIVADELSVLLGGTAQDTTLIQFLTKAYDCPDNFEYLTLIRGREVANRVCLNMLAGTTVEWVRGSLPPHAVGGGFTSRIVFVYQERSWRRNAFPVLTAEQRVMQDHLLKDLVEIKQMNGPYSLTERARAWYVTWYEEVFSPDDNDASLRGYFARKHDTLLKIGICLAASRRTELVVEEKDLEDGLIMMNENEKHLPKVMELIQTTPTGDINTRVLGTITRKGEITYTDLLRRVSYFLSAKDLRVVLDSLVGSGVVEEEVKGRTVVYRPKRGIG